MTRLLLQWLMMLALVVPVAALAQSDFRAVSTTTTTAEGGAEHILLIETDNERFSLSIPKGYGAQAHPEIRAVVFSSESGDSIINVQFRTNYPVALPKRDNLRDQVAAAHPEASLVASAPAGTGVGPAQSFDLFQPASNNQLLRVRYVYVSYPEGSVELTFSCNSGDFDKQKLGFMRLLNSFRLLSKDGNTNP